MKRAISAVKRSNRLINVKSPGYANPFQSLCIDGESGLTVPTRLVLSRGHLESTMTNEVTITLESAWDFFMAEVAKAQPSGEVVIPSGKGTNLYVRVNPKKLPASIALDLIEAGIRKPLTDISLSPEEAGSWQYAHERRLKRLANWMEGKFSVRGGATDEIGAQMKVEWEEELKTKGLDPRKDEHKPYFKGTVTAMMDTCLAAGMKFDREAMLAEMNKRAIAKLAKRGEAAKKLDVTSITF